MKRELWKLLYVVAQQFDKVWGSWRYSVSDILAVYFWAVVHDRPISWATHPENWPDDLRPHPLPSQDRMSRRLAKWETVQLMVEVEDYITAITSFGCAWLRIIDAKPLTISNISGDPDAGFGHGAGRREKGYKLFAIYGGGPMPVAWALGPMKSSEKTLARSLIPGLQGAGYLLGDKQYDVNGLYDLAAQVHHQLVAPKTAGRGIGHRRQSPARLRSIDLATRPFGRALIAARRAVETQFGNLTSFGGGLGPLPAWVRRFPRVRNWVHAKLLINGARWLLRKKKKLTLAFA